MTALTAKYQPRRIRDFAGLQRDILEYHLTANLPMFHNSIVPNGKQKDHPAYRPPVAWERWCRIVSAAAAAQIPPGEYFIDLIERGLPPAFRKVGK